MHVTFNVWMLLMFSLQHYVDSMTQCDNMKTIIRAEGVDVSLQLDKSGIKEVSWLMGGRHIATTKSMDTIDVKSQIFKGRLSQISSNSLKIKEITRMDEGLYVAHIFMKSGQEFVQCYNISIHRKLTKDNIFVLPNIYHNGSCAVSLTCKVNLTDVTVTWNRDDLAMTNDTLYLDNVEPSSNYSCTAINQVSNASIDVKPWNYCRTAKDVEGVTDIPTVYAQVKQDRRESFATIYSEVKKTNTFPRLIY
ncbi:SLAM family member 9-like [Pelobates fuscus]|uniref:SLAM family member 9-like n=1 Tax=Pelobates fuscus TaxID=191477 RepID=UPI002FE4E0A4